MFATIKTLALRAAIISALGGGAWGTTALVASLSDNPAAAMAQRLLERVAGGVLDTGAELASSTLGGLGEQASDLLGGGGAQDAPGRVHGTIVKVADGDTVTVRLDAGGKTSVRFLGIDAPESSALRRGHAECGGQQAKALMGRLAARHRRVTLVSDPSQDERDRYDRALAYVVPRGGGPSLQQQMLEAGLAQVYVFRKNHPPARTTQFRKAAALAEREHRGVHALCGGSFTRPIS